MRPTLLVFTLGILLLLFSAALLPSAIVSLLYRDGQLLQLGITLAISLAVGLALSLPFIHMQHRLRNRDGFVVVALLWVATSALGSLPFIFGLHMHLTDAVFESVSGFTTTGSTVIVGLDKLPPSILFFRQELQWLGGIGVIVTAIAVLPMLGVGGMQLLKAETPGPMKDDKLTPRITRTAQTLWRTYFLMTAACALFLWLAGMPAFDAIAHSFATVSTGGYSTHDASFAYFNSPAIEAVAEVFMLLGSMNFSLHFIVWRQLAFSQYWRNVETRAYVLTVLAATAITTVVLYLTRVHGSVAEAFRYAVFQVVTCITTTGFGTEDFSRWPLLLPALLMLIACIGGCAGSSAGGIKVIRIAMLARQVSLQVHRLIHPQMVRPLKLAGRVIPESVAEAVWAFFAVYVGVFLVMMLLLMCTGMDQVSAFGAVAACVNNLGPGLGSVAANFADISTGAKWLLSVTMLLGRLEIFTLFVLLTPAFWRQ
jgi:trk/ktr system potassium uptake protein